MNIATSGMVAGILIGLNIGDANAACLANMGSDWRKVGAGSNIKYVCKNDFCGGAGSYIFVKVLKSLNFSSHGFLADMKSGGRIVGSPIHGLVGIRKEIASNNGYRTIEVYYAKNKRGIDMPYVESKSGSKSVSKSNFAKSKKFPVLQITEF